MRSFRRYKVKVSLLPEETARKRSPQAIALWASTLACLAIYAPILFFMVRHWQAVSDYSHGFIVAPLAVYFLWQRKPLLQKLPMVPSWWGVPVLAASSLTLTIGRLGVELMNMRVSFVLALHGLILLFAGVRIYRIALFPLAFLFLMVPLPQSLVNVIAFPLQLIAAKSAAVALYWLGIPALLEGNIIHLANTQLFVEEACSGLRSLMALVTLGVIFAYFFRRSWGERIVIVASAIPIAILVNAFRVGLTGVLTHHYGKEAAGGWIHQTEGLFTFAIAFVLLLVEAWLLEKMWPSRWRPTKRVLA